MSLLDFRFIKRLFNVTPIDQVLAVGDQVDSALNKLQGQVNTVKARPAIETITTTAGSFTANSPTSSISIVGDGNLISTTISGNTLTISSSAPTVADTLAYAIALG